MVTGYRGLWFRNFFGSDGIEGRLLVGRLRSLVLRETAGQKKTHNDGNKSRCFSSLGEA